MDTNKTSHSLVNGHSVALHNLPAELLIHIYTHLPTAQAVARLSRTCKPLYEFTKKEGWKTFTRVRFPSVSVPTSLEEHVHVARGLTTLSRNWDRKAFIARYTQPSGSITGGVTGKVHSSWDRPSGQTMGYQPCIDSYDSCLGPHWSTKREVLAWSAGAQLIIRLKEPGKHAASLKAPRHSPTRTDRSSFKSEGTHNLDVHGHPVKWYTWKRQGGMEVRDDITALKLIRSPGEDAVRSASEKVLVGTANGALDLLELLPDMGRVQHRIAYTTNGRPVRSFDASDELLVACISNPTLAVYPMSQEGTESIAPNHELELLPENHRDCRVWNTKLLHGARLAVGLGPSAHPLHIYELSPTGIVGTPLRKFGLYNEDYPRSSTVYPIAPLSTTSNAGHSVGEVFLSGCYDGIIRLHDMRSPAEFVSSYTDPNDDSAIYCLQTLGRERLVAGTFRYSMMKFFDLRVSGGRVYHYIDAFSGQTSEPGSDQSNGWNLFVNPRNRSAIPNLPPTYRHRRNLDSPVYALSSPSSSSSSLYAGVENSIVQFDFVSMLDRHPDPVSSPAMKRIPRTGDLDIKGTWNPRGDVLNLGMYEQNGDGAVRLRMQRGIGRYPGSLPGSDQRWTDGKDI